MSHGPWGAYIAPALLPLLTAGCTPVVTPDLGLSPVLQDPASGLCISMQLDRWDAAHRAAQVAALGDLGVREVREDLRWSYAEPSRGTWDWTTEDAVVDGVTNDLGASMIAMLGYGNPWATSVPDADSFYPPDDPADFATFAAAAVTRYGDRVHRWEIWNEPNAGFRFWKQQPYSLDGDPAGYADLFVAAADAIHGVDPQAQVILGGVFFHSQGYMGGVDFLQKVVDARPEVLDKADAVAFHSYTLYPPREPPEADTGGEVALPDMIAQVRAVTGDLPVVITESGWPSFDTVSESEQAAWIVREVALAQANGVRDACVYTLEDGADPQGNPEDAFGLYQQGATAQKPSGAAFQALAAALSQTATGYGHAETALRLPSGVTAIRYGGDRTVTVVWSTGDPADVEISPVERGCGPVAVHATGTPSLVVQGGGCSPR